MSLLAWRSIVFPARIHAAFIHFAITVLICGSILLAAVYLWFPGPTFELAEAYQIFLLILFCDIVLGPSITLMIFSPKKQKKELVRDMTVICTVQIIALTFGVWSLIQGRVLFLVYNYGQFNVVFANEIMDEGGVQETVGVKVPPLYSGPSVIGARLPDDPKERQDLMFGALQGKGDIFNYPRYFVAYKDQRNHAIQRSLSLKQFTSKYGISESTLDKKVKDKYLSDNVNYGLLPGVVRKKLVAIVIDRSNGNLIDILKTK